MIFQKNIVNFFNIIFNFFFFYFENFLSFFFYVLNAIQLNQKILTIFNNIFDNNLFIYFFITEEKECIDCNDCVKIYKEHFLFTLSYFFENMM